ncbi:transglutaminase domain-containing protein [Clostridium sp. 001]|uniref:transglutaminase domain-containing protein n=1 Tax=Clostridium sp. 001 TaxID=1970093 RepID=UPI001C2C27C9|nr:transglutaminase domain-containing protein [Clostridium sp. 001]QXE20180.1 hypothetical protein B5S50_15830 [Clostridium sp. 001]
MFKKIGKFIVVAVVCGFLFVGKDCYAAENYKIWNNDATSNVANNKTWTISFNKNIDINSAKNSIKVYEQDNNQSVAVNVVSSKSDVVQVSPENPYTSGEKYVLVIDNNLKSTDGKQLNEGVKYNFTVNGQNGSNGEISIQNYTQYYNAVKDALSNYKDTLVLNITNYDRSTYNLGVIDKILKDNPNLRDWYSSAGSNVESSSSTKMTINFKYDDTKQNLIAKENAIQQKVDQVVNSVTTPQMKDYEKELALHDYVVNNTEYDQRAVTGNMPNDSYTAYGVLVNKTAVCQGYADAMDRLLAAADIECKMVIGQGNDGDGWISHAWNIVKIQGQYYQVDSTWDDPVTNDGSKLLSHSYFNITDSQIAKNHEWDKSDYPECNSTDYSFSKLGVTEKDKYGNDIKVVDNYNDFYNALKNYVISQRQSFSIKILNYNSTNYNVPKNLKQIVTKYNIYGDYNLTYYSDEISGAEVFTIVKS